MLLIILIVVIAFLIYGLRVNNKLSKENEQLKYQIGELTDEITSLREKQSKSKKINDLSKVKSDVDIPITTTTSWDDNANTNYSKPNKLDVEYQKIRQSRPDYETHYGRPFNYPSFTDKYDTKTGFSLRELLLLIWWGKIKKGRLVTARIPKYFIYNYNLNVQKVTQKFVNKGWLIKNDDRYSLSDKARTVADFYSELWEMHQSSSFPICLDEDFPNWNHGELRIKFYMNEIEFQYKLINYYLKLEAFYKKHPKFDIDGQTQYHHLHYIKQSILEAKTEIENNKERIKALS